MILMTTFKWITIIFHQTLFPKAKHLWDEANVAPSMSNHENWNNDWFVWGSLVIVRLSLWLISPRKIHVICSYSVHPRTEMWLCLNIISTLLLLHVALTPGPITASLSSVCTPCSVPQHNPEWVICHVWKQQAACNKSNWQPLKMQITKK